MSKKQRIIDAKLVVEYQSGNNKALELLVKRWHTSFCQKAFWIVKDTDVAKDIAQDSWNVIIDKIGSLKNENSFGSWSLRIVCNKSFDWIKANNKKRSALLDLQYEEAFEIDEHDENALLKKAILEGVKQLSMQQQVVIKLFYTENYSLKEIGKALNISVGTAKSRLFHAREKLKLILRANSW